MKDNLLLWIWLSNIKGIGCITAKMLLNRFKEPERIYNATKDELREIAGLGTVRIECILNSRSLEHAKSILEKCKKLGISILAYDDNLYPKRARDTERAPIVLYYRGSIREENIGVGIVGSRRCTEYGKRVAVEAAEFLAQHKIPVISGMAKGIDSYAHTACLNKGGYTIAFLGCGVDICYPIEHRELMKKIIENGAVLSEYTPGTKPEPTHFPERNRLISAWSEKILIVEASINSGALITAKIAKAQGREILAAPNNIYVPEGSGTNWLIQNDAKIYLNPQQLLIKELSYPQKVKYVTNEDDQNLNASSLENRILILLKNKTMSTSELMEVLRESKEALIEQIAIMELEGKIRSTPGGRLAILEH
jgi:DNA processing protein